MKKNKEKNNKIIEKFLMTIIILIIVVISVIFIMLITKKEEEKTEYVVDLENIAEIKKEEILKIGVKEKIKEELKPEILEPETMETTYHGFQIIGKIMIPKTELDIPIINSVTVQGMKEAPCLLYTTGELNKSGNTYIVGHNYVNNTLFSNNGKLEIGDKIYITTLDNVTKEYIIYDKFITTAEDVSYLKRDIGESPEITLQSCTNNNVSRIIILAK